MKDIVGKRFGKLVVLGKVDAGKYQYKSLCLCDCGNTKVVLNGSLASGNTKSCGCIVNKHGMKNTSTYNIWDTMIARCHRPSHKSYKDYGGRGIVVCEEWRIFQNFFDDMGTRPTKTSQLDRIDNNKGYSKENCRWVSPSQNCRNRRNTHIIEYNGMSKCLSEWSDITGIKTTAIHERLKMGWSVERALTENTHKYTRKNTQFAELLKESKSCG